jgi:hypothetical protein
MLTALGVYIQMYRDPSCRRLNLDCRRFNLPFWPLGRIPPRCLQETLWNSLYSFPFIYDKVMIGLHCWVSRMWCYLSTVSRPSIQMLCIGYRQEALWVSNKMFLCPRMSNNLKGAEMLDNCHSQQCRSLMTLSGQKGRQIRYRKIADFAYWLCCLNSWLYSLLFCMVQRW